MIMMDSTAPHTKLETDRLRQEYEERRRARESGQLREWTPHQREPTATSSNMEPVAATTRQISDAIRVAVARRTEACSR